MKFYVLTFSSLLLATAAVTQAAAKPGAATYPFFLDNEDVKDEPSSTKTLLRGADESGFAGATEERNLKKKKKNKCPDPSLTYCKCDCGEFCLVDQQCTPEFCLQACGDR
jgi:hypothetical protein